MMKNLKKQLRLTDLDFLQYVQELSPLQLKGLNYNLSLNPMALTYSIGCDSYVHYLHEIKRQGKTLIVNSLKEGEIYDQEELEQGFEHTNNPNEIFTFKNDRYSLKGRNYGSLNFNELIEKRDLER